MQKESMKAAGYKYRGFCKLERLHILEDIATGRLELFAANKGHAGWGIHWRGTDLEFVRGADDPGPIFPC